MKDFIEDAIAQIEALQPFQKVVAAILFTLVVISLAGLIFGI